MKTNQNKRQEREAYDLGRIDFETSKNTIHQYRTEIDGLRCIAVLAVIFFHADFSSFKGGFVGVDVFFVISGYLMTGIILNEKASGTFTLLRFYERRARRILPMLYFTLFACYLPAYRYLIEKEFKFFTRSVSWASFGSSNFLFSTTTQGYFDTATNLIPLVHTWTLGVEEQFYVIIPLIFVSIWPLGKHTVLFVINALATVSFCLTFLTMNATFKFYMLYTRFWELAIGSIVVFVPKQTKSELFSCAGSCAILTSILAYNEDLPNPSFYTLLPTLGTAVFILYSEGTFIAKILSNSIISKIGLISYSAYLLHQPIFAFMRVQSLTPLSDLEYVSLIFLTLTFSFFTWKFIENPFRNKSLVSFRKVVYLIVIFLTCSQVFNFMVVNKVNNSNQQASRTSTNEYSSGGGSKISTKVNASLPIYTEFTSVYISKVFIPKFAANKENFSQTNANHFFPNSIYFPPYSQIVDECFIKYNKATNNKKLFLCSLGIKKSAASLNLAQGSSYVLTGDSQSAQLLTAFDEFDGEIGLFASNVHCCYHCRNLLYREYSENERNSYNFLCPSIQTGIYEYVKQRNQAGDDSAHFSSIKKIFFANLWFHYRYKTDLHYEGRPEVLTITVTNLNLLEKDLNYTINAYAALNVHVYILQQIPSQPVEPSQLYQNLLAKNELTDQNLRKYSTKRADFRKSQEGIEKIFSKFKSNPNVTFIYIEDLMCDDEYCPIGIVDESYYYDPLHLSLNKVMKIKDRFLRYLKRE